VLTPQQQTIRAQLELLAPDGSTIGSVSATAAGKTIYLQTLPVAAGGTYTVRVMSLDGTGGYTVELFLNSAVETEAYTGIPNNTIAGAQDIDSSAIAIAGGADRVAVLGELTGDVDVYAFSLTAGQWATMSAWSRSGGAVVLQLWDGNGILLTTGKTVSALRSDSTIRSFMAPASGTYFARVSGDAGTAYTLVVTRGADVDIAANDSLPIADWLRGAHRVVGGFGGAGETVTDFSDGFGNVSLDGFTATGLWHVTNTLNYGGQLPGHSQPEFAYFGNSNTGNYNFGRVSGELVSPRFRVWYVDPVLRFNYRLQTETPYPNSWDRAEVYVVPQNGSLVKIAQKGSTQGLPAMVHTLEWTPMAVSLAAFAGEEIQIRFWFDSGDGLYNNYLGWQIDDVRLPVISDAEDFFCFEPNAGDVLTITTMTPGGDEGEPQNLLDPKVELYDSDGTLVAADDNGAADARNVLLIYSVPAGGTYFLRVCPATGTLGDYVLNIQGATGNPPELVVSATTPSDGALLSGFPTTYRVDFSEPILLTSVSAEDLTVNGIPADSFAVIDADTIEFTIASANSGDGVYQVEIVAGAITSVSGRPLQLFRANFDCDATNPWVTASSIEENDVIAPGRLVYQVRFSEELATAHLGPEDVTLVDSITGASITPSALTYDPTTSTATVTYDNLAEGNYTLTLLTSATAFRDRRGNLLDGSPSFFLPSGDGVPGDPFVVQFQVDSSTVAFPVPLTPLAPAGGLIYARTVAGALNATNDVEEFTIELDRGQTASLVLIPQAGVRARLELLAPDGSLVGSAEGSANGQKVFLQTVPVVTGGTYRIQVSSVNGAGTFNLRMILNAAIEAEWLGGPGNNSLPEAQNLAGAWIELGNGSARAAVLGAADGAGGTADLYRMDFAAREVVTWLLTGLAVNQLSLEVLDSAGTVVALGAGGAANVGRSIREFVVPASGTYYARVLGVGDYSLVVARNISRWPTTCTLPISRPVPDRNGPPVAPTTRWALLLGSWGASATVPPR